MPRLNELIKLYNLIDLVEERQGGKRTLNFCHGRMGWPKQGVYFFFEEGELRLQSGDGMRVVRVGTHALTATSRATLWSRLRQHKGNAQNSTGNHRGSIFRLLLGEALQLRAQINCPTWGQGNNASAVVRLNEVPFETQVSQYIGTSMPFIVLEVVTPELRTQIERNCIALLSNSERTPLDPHSSNWLGLHSPRPLVLQSGLWNQQHVNEVWQPGFVDELMQPLLQ